MNTSTLKNQNTSKIKSFYFNFQFITEKDFSKLILSNFDFNNTYSVLLKIENNKETFVMIGPQIGFVLDTNTHTTSINTLYNTILYRIHNFDEYSSVELGNSIQIIFIKINIIPELLADK